MRHLRDRRAEERRSVRAQFFEAVGLAFATLFAVAGACVLIALVVHAAHAVQL